MQFTRSLLRQWGDREGEGLMTDGFRDFTIPDPDDDGSVPLGNALAELAVDVEIDSVEAVRDVRERSAKR